MMQSPGWQSHRSTWIRWDVRWDCGAESGQEMLSPGWQSHRSTWTRQHSVRSISASSPLSVRYQSVSLDLAFNVRCGCSLSASSPLLVCSLSAPSPRAWTSPLASIAATSGTGGNAAVAAYRPCGDAGFAVGSSLAVDIAGAGLESAARL